MIKKIPNYENYEVDSSGFVKNTRTGRVLKVDISNRGYHRITVCKDNKTKKFSLHRLIAELFIPNPNSLKTVNHIKTKADNSYLDLEWMTQADNQLHAVTNNLCPKGSDNGNSKWDEITIDFVCKLIAEGHIRGFILYKTGITKATFDDIKRRKTWVHISMGYNW